MKLAENFLRGSYPPIVTPFKDGQVDYDTYATLVEFQVRSGTHGIVVNGTTSEPSTLTLAERNKLVSTAIDVAAKRIPVVAATGSQNLHESIELSDHATRSGADALLVVTPYYIRPPQRGLVAYFNQLAERTPLPFLIYHIPGRTAVSVELDTLEQIAEKSSNLVGIKHAVNDFALVTAALKRFGEGFRVFVGLEELTFPMMSIGACGTMNAVANLVPQKIAALCEAVLKRDLLLARGLHMELDELNRSVFFDTNPIPIKYMMKQLGLLPDNEHRLPMTPATASLMRRLDEVMKKAGLR